MTKDEYLQLLLNKGINRTVQTKDQQTAVSDKYPQGYFKAKKCKQCGQVFIPQAPSEHYCSDFCKRFNYLSRYYERNYNMTLDEYLNLAEKQNFKCALCGQENYAMKDIHSGALVVDHNHETGEVRGLLCHNCNRALGLLQDSIHTIDKIIPYLKGATTIPIGSTSEANADGKTELLAG